MLESIEDNIISIGDQNFSFSDDEINESSLIDLDDDTFNVQFNNDFENDSIYFSNHFHLNLEKYLKNQFLLLFPIGFPESFFKKIFTKEYHCIFAYTNKTNELIGFIIIKVFHNHDDDDNEAKDSGLNRAEILALAVIKEFQRKNIGSRLLIEALYKLYIMNIYKVELMVQESNLAALGLYMKYGFIVKERINDYYSKFNENYYFEEDDVVININNNVNNICKVKNIKNNKIGLKMIKYLRTLDDLSSFIISNRNGLFK